MMAVVLWIRKCTLDPIRKDILLRPEPLQP